MRRTIVRIAIPAAVLVGLVAGRSAWKAANVASGYAAKLTCSLSLNSGQPPARIRSELLDHVLSPVAALVRLQPADCCARASLAGLAGARAIWRRGFGCTLLSGGDEKDAAVLGEGVARDALDPTIPWPNGDAGPGGPAQPAIGTVTSPAIDAAIHPAIDAAIDPAIDAAIHPAIDAAIDAAIDPAIGAAIDEAFREPGGYRVRQTKAVLVVHRGRLVAERYADGYSAATPMISWSMAKSVLASLVGIAISEGRLARDEPAPVPEWSSPGDPRHAITLDQLLRMSSGLRFDETYGATNDVSTMLFTEPDMGAFAAGMPLAAAPDSVWSYSSGTSNIVARLLLAKLGGDPAAFVRYAREKLFDPVLMRSAFFEHDAAGTPVGSSFVFMTPRDWARFGELHRRDGVWNGNRVLPEGWVKYVTTPTPKAPKGEYGAHWWLNAGEPGDPAKRAWPSLPVDAYSARGYSGQWVLVIPSRELVVVRLGISFPDDGDDGTEQLAAAVLEALPD